MSKTLHEASDAQDITGTDVFLAKESPRPPKKAGTARQHALKWATSPVGETQMNFCPGKAAMVIHGPFFDGFHVEDSSTTLDRANLDVFHTIRIDIMSVPPTELIGSLAETSAETECLISVGYHTGGPLITLGMAETEGDRALKGLVLSNYVLSPSRVGIEELGVPGGNEGGRVECASDIQGIDTSYQTNQSVLTLTEVETTYIDKGLGDMDSSSPLMTINPLGLVVMAELNSNTEVMRFDNTLKVSNWVKHKLPSFSKMIGLSLG